MATNIVLSAEQRRKGMALLEAKEGPLAGSEDHKLVLDFIGYAIEKGRKIAAARTESESLIDAARP